MKSAVISFSARRLPILASLATIIALLMMNNVNISQCQPMKLIFPEDSHEVTGGTMSESSTSPPPITGCPRGMYFHNETQKCWRVKQQGPCSKSMIFFRVDTKYGDCDCPEVNASTVWVYDLASNQCFRTYQQAFCATGEWLIFQDNSDMPKCAPNSCEKFQRENPADHELYPVVLLRNKCVRVLKSSDEADCSSPHEVTIDPYTGTPFCSSDAGIQNYDIGVKGSFKCRPGTRRDRLGKCRPVTNNKVSFRPPSR